jgi:hypothetical protein
MPTIAPIQEALGSTGHGGPIGDRPLNRRFDSSRRSRDDRGSPTQRRTNGPPS